MDFGQQYLGAAIVLALLGLALWWLRRRGYTAATPGRRAGLSVPMQIILLMTLMTLLQAAVMCVTPFLRITIVLHFLRQALGTQSTPSNQVLLGLSLFLTIVIMQPVVTDMYRQGWEPMEAGRITAGQAFEDGSKPLSAFLTRFAREKDIRLFVEFAHEPAPNNRSG